MQASFTAESMPHLRAVLEQYGIALRNAYQDNLIRSGRIASGELLNSVEVRVDGPTGGTWSVVFSLAEWWKWVEDDTRPHWPPPGALIPWIRVKPVIPRPDEKTGRLPTEKQLDYLIRRRIAGKSPSGKPGGTKGTHDLERAEQSTLPKWQAKIQQALLQDASDWTRVYITETFRDINPAPVEI